MGLFSRLYPEPRHPLYRKVQKLLSKGCQEQLLRKNARSKIFYIITHPELMAFFLHFAISLYIGGWRILGPNFWEAFYVGVRRFLQEIFYIKSIRETAICIFGIIFNSYVRGYQH